MATIIKGTIVNNAKTLSKRFKYLQNASVSVGWHEDSKYDDGTQIAEIAAIQEYGTGDGKIPPRSFMRSTANEKLKTVWLVNLKKVIAHYVSKGGDLSQLYGKFGASISGDIAEKITQIWTPPLAESTVKNRVSRKSKKATTESLTKPLIDTGVMLASLSFKVLFGGKK